MAGVGAGLLLSRYKSTAYETVRGAYETARGRLWTTNWALEGHKAQVLVAAHDGALVVLVAIPPVSCYTPAHKT
jgi:hypothetical protein